MAAVLPILIFIPNVPGNLQKRRSGNPDRRFLLGGFFTMQAIYATLKQINFKSLSPNSSLTQRVHLGFVQYGRKEEAHYELQNSHCGR